MSMDKITVCAAFDFLQQEEIVGTLSHEYLRGKDVYSFAFHPQWLADHPRIKLGADLFSHAGLQYSFDSRLFGCFEDCSPDRWGRVLIREHFYNSHPETRRPLSGWDYLLGVNDYTRSGGLRFRDSQGQAINELKGIHEVPPLTSLGQLQDVAEIVERNEAAHIPTDEKILRQIVAPGSSAGGARPKAAIEDKGVLYIAKFPSVTDTTDAARLEHFAHLLAKECQLNVADTRVCQLGKKHGTLLTRRFDRDYQRRIHMASSLTLTGLHDGDGADTGKGYLDIVDAIERFSSSVKDDIRELYGRIAYNICIGNTDDHFRNHSFLLNEKGWRLSPAYDLNPTDGYHHALLINDYTNESSLDILYASHADYRLTSDEAHAIISDIRRNVYYWEDIADKAGVSRADTEALSRRIDAGLEYSYGGGMKR